MGPFCFGIDGHGYFIVLGMLIVAPFPAILHIEANEELLMVGDELP